MGRDGYQEPFVVASPAIQCDNSPEPRIRLNPSTVTGVCEHVDTTGRNSIATLMGLRFHEKVVYAIQAPRTHPRNASLIILLFTGLSGNMNMPATAQSVHISMSRLHMIFLQVIKVAPGAAE